MLYVFGHTNPDTDSFCSAVVYAQYLNDTGVPAKAIVLGTPNNETKYVFESAGVAFPEQLDSLPAGSEVVLVDHNEASQSIAGRDDLVISQVIDHHKISDFITSGPLMMRIEPVGCTCTILYEIFKEKGYAPSASLAYLMASAIISDTLYYRSPTTRPRDKEALESLVGIAGIKDAEAYSMEMFNAKSDLGDMPAKDIVTLDYKTFDFSGNAMGIGVMETTNPGYALGRKDEILTAIQKVKEETGLEQLLFCVIDILNSRNTAFVCSEREEEIVSGAFGVDSIHNTSDLGGRVSRKKQIAPDIDAWFKG